VTTRRNERLDLPGFSDGVARWVVHTDELMVRYIDEGKVIYYSEADSLHWIGELCDLDEAKPV